MYLDIIKSKYCFVVENKKDKILPLVDVIEKSKEFNSKLHVINFDLADVDPISPSIRNI